MPFPKLRGQIRAVAIVDIRMRITDGLVEFVREASRRPTFICQRRFFKKSLQQLRLRWLDQTGACEKSSCGRLPEVGAMLACRIGMQQKRYLHAEVQGKRFRHVGMQQASIPYAKSWRAGFCHMAPERARIREAPECSSGARRPWHARNRGKHRQLHRALRRRRPCFLDPLRTQTRAQTGITPPLWRRRSKCSTRYRSSGVSPKSLAPQDKSHVRQAPPRYMHSGWCDCADPRHLPMQAAQTMPQIEAYRAKRPDTRQDPRSRVRRAQQLRCTCVSIFGLPWRQCTLCAPQMHDEFGPWGSTHYESRPRGVTQRAAGCISE